MFPDDRNQELVEQSHFTSHKYNRIQLNCGGEGGGDGGGNKVGLLDYGRGLKSQIVGDYLVISGGSQIWNKSRVDVCDLKYKHYIGQFEDALPRDVNWFYHGFHSITRRDDLKKFGDSF